MDGTVRDTLLKDWISYLDNEIQDNLDDGYEVKSYADRSDDEGRSQGVRGLQVSVRASMPAVAGRDKNGRPFEWAYTMDTIIPLHARYARSNPDRMDELSQVIHNTVLLLEVSDVNLWLGEDAHYSCTYLREADGDYIFGEDFEEFYIPLEIGIAEDDVEVSE